MLVWAKDMTSRWVPPGCVGWPASERYRIVVAIAGSFRHDGSVEDLLARFGAIATTRGLRYWSVTDKAWRVLITDSTALNGLDTEQRRADFTPGELKSGTSHYFAQDDSRSFGPVLYRMTVLERRDDRIVISTENLGPVRAFLATLFPPGSLRATYIVQRREPGVWSFYGLTGTAQSASPLAGDHEASYVNRAVALYRHFVGIADDAEPPAAQ